MKIELNLGKSGYGWFLVSIILFIFITFLVTKSANLFETIFLSLLAIFSIYVMVRFFKKIGKDRKEVVEVESFQVLN